jgi:hypothetical protein
VHQKDFSIFRALKNAPQETGLLRVSLEDRQTNEARLLQYLK